MSRVPNARSGQSTVSLVSAAGAGDATAWEELIRRYGGMVRATIASFRLQDADAGDALQNTWLRLVERLDTIRDPDRLGGWLATTASRECLALIRRRQREVPQDAVATELAAGEPGPDVVVVEHEARQAVQSAVSSLAGRYQQLAHALFYRPECGYAEVSRSTGIPVGSIGPSRGRLLKDMRGTLEHLGHGPERVAS